MRDEAPALESLGLSEHAFVVRKSQHWRGVIDPDARETDREVAMKTRTARRKLFFWPWAALVLTLACAGTSDKQEKWPAAQRSDWQHEEDPCKEPGGEPRSCKSDDDCCEGYVCTQDPERSRYVNYCIET